MENVFLTSLTVPEVKQLLRSEIESYFAANPQQSKSEPEHEYLTLPEAASYLRLAAQSVYGLIHRKKIKHHKRGKKLYFKKADLAEYIQSGRRQTVEETQAEAETKMIELNT